MKSTDLRFTDEDVAAMVPAVAFDREYCIEIISTKREGRNLWIDEVGYCQPPMDPEQIAKNFDSYIKATTVPASVLAIAFERISINSQPSTKDRSE